MRLRYPSTSVLSGSSRRGSAPWRCRGRPSRPARSASMPLGSTQRTWRASKRRAARPGGGHAVEEVVHGLLVQGSGNGDDLHDPLLRCALLLHVGEAPAEVPESPRAPRCSTLRAASRLASRMASSRPSPARSRAKKVAPHTSPHPVGSPRRRPGRSRRATRRGRRGHPRTASPAGPPACRVRTRSRRGHVGGAPGPSVTVRSFRSGPRASAARCHGSPAGPPRSSNSSSFICTPSKQRSQSRPPLERPGHAHARGR